jgi:hypothetical protein
LKDKEIGKTPKPSVHKRIEGKDLAEFFGQKTKRARERWDAGRLTGSGVINKYNT